MRERSNSNVVATVEARMGSTRLPGKVLLPALGKPMLYHLVHRLKHVNEIDNIILATTTNPEDDVLEDFAKQNNILCYRGSQHNVMLRVIEAAKFANAAVIVEITGDCPVIDPEIIAQTINIFYSNQYEYVSNVHVRSYPDGMDVQVFALETLQKSFHLTNNPLDLEHVTLHIRNNPSIFTHLNVFAPPRLYMPELGLTLDEQDDYLLLKLIIESLAPQKQYFSCYDILRLLNQNKSFFNINSHVIRKKNT